MNSARRSLLGMLAGGLAWGAPVWAQGKAVIGVSMPTVTSQRWVSDGLAITKALDGLGYRPESQYA